MYFLRHVKGYVIVPAHEKDKQKTSKKHVRGHMIVLVHKTTKQSTDITSNTCTSTCQSTTLGIGNAHKVMMLHAHNKTALFINFTSKVLSVVCGKWRGG